MTFFKTNNKQVDEDKVPTSVDEAIPVRDTFDDGIFLVGRNKYSKMFRFTDINYANKIEHRCI